MREPFDNGTGRPHRSRSDWGIALAIALAIVICLVAFVWIYIGLEPFMGDFIGSEITETPEPDILTDPTDPTDPTVVPTANP